MWFRTTGPKGWGGGWGHTPPHSYPTAEPSLSIKFLARHMRCFWHNLLPTLSVQVCCAALAYTSCVLERNWLIASQKKGSRAAYTYIQCLYVCVKAPTGKMFLTKEALFGCSYRLTEGIKNAKKENHTCGRLVIHPLQPSSHQVKELPAGYSHCYVSHIPLSEYSICRSFLERKKCAWACLFHPLLDRENENGHKNRLEVRNCSNNCYIVPWAIWPVPSVFGRVARWLIAWLTALRGCFPVWTWFSCSERNKFWWTFEKAGRISLEPPVFF